jgi:AcrR family transcriptional regulator
VKTQRDLHQESTRRSILRNARQLFTQKGYSATTLQAVVHAARVTTGAVYHHFGVKKGIYFARSQTAYQASQRTE